MNLKYPLALICVLLSLSCSEEIVSPPDGEPPGKREYVWSVDTLTRPNAFQTFMRDMWGSSPRNVYVVGHSSEVRGSTFRYTGYYWATVPVTMNEGGTISGAISLTAIHGVDSTELWAVGEEVYINPLPPPNFLDSSLIIHYKGGTWSKISLPDRRSALYCVHGSGAGSVFAAGRGIIYRYDGTQWSLYELGNEMFFASIACLAPDDVYALGHVEDQALPVDSLGDYLWHFDGAGWKVIDSVSMIPGAPPRHFGNSVWSDGKTLYSLGPALYEWTGGGWKELLAAKVGQMWKSGARNILAVGDNVYQYNGTNWAVLDAPALMSGNIRLGCYSDGSEAFILETDGFRSWVLHGR